MGGRTGSQEMRKQILVLPTGWPSGPLAMLEISFHDGSPINRDKSNEYAVAKLTPRRPPWVRWVRKGEMQAVL